MEKILSLNAHRVYANALAPKEGRKMVDARVSLSEYTNRVLGVVKAKYGLRDKSEAINKFVEEYGAEEFEPQVKDSYVKKLQKIEKEHLKKYGYRNMGIKELDALFKKKK